METGTRTRDPADMTIEFRAVHVINEVHAARVVYGIVAVNEVETAAVFIRTGIEDSTSTVDVFSGSVPQTKLIRVVCSAGQRFGKSKRNLHLKSCLS